MAPLSDPNVRTSLIKDKEDGVSMLENRCFKQAEPHFRQALDHTREQKNGETFMLAQRLAECLIGQRKWAEALKELQIPLLGYRKYGLEDEDYLDTQCLLGHCLHGQGKNGEAQTLLETTLEALETNLKRGPDHPITMKCRVLLAQTFKGMYNFAKAEELANYNIELLEVVKMKTEKNEISGSRRLTHPERVAYREIEQLSVKIVGVENLKIQRAPTIETDVPDSEYSGSAATSRAPSKQSCNGGYN